MIKNLLIIFAVYKTYQYLSSQKEAAPQAAPASQGVAIPTQEQLRDMAIAQGTRIIKDTVLPFVKDRADRIY